MLLTFFGVANDFNIVYNVNNIVSKRTKEFTSFIVYMALLMG